MVSTASANQALKDAVEATGGQSALARLIGTSQAAVWKWVRMGKLLPAEHVLTVEEATGISRHRLRPDVYGPEPIADAVSPAVGAAS